MTPEPSSLLTVHCSPLTLRGTADLGEDCLCVGVLCEMFPHLPPEPSPSQCSPSQCSLFSAHPLVPSLNADQLPRERLGAVGRVGHRVEEFVDSVDQGFLQPSLVKPCPGSVPKDEARFNTVLAQYRTT
eukprot:1733752-Rhodomonas_salina.1